MGHTLTESVSFSFDGKQIEVRLRMPEGETLEQAVAHRMAVIERRDTSGTSGGDGWLDFVTVRSPEEIALARRCLLAAKARNAEENRPARLDWLEHNYLDLRITDQDGEDVASVTIEWKDTAAEFALELARASKEFLELANKHVGETLTVDPDID